MYIQDLVKKPGLLESRFLSVGVGDKAEKTQWSQVGRDPGDFCDSASLVEGNGGETSS